MEKNKKKPESSLLKAQFSEIVDNYDREFKTNNLLYRNKYFELNHFVYQMHEEAKKCYSTILHRNKKSSEKQKLESQQNSYQL